MLCVMMLPLVVVGCTSKQSVRPRSYSRLRRIMQPPPDWQTPLNGDYFTLRERLITMQKQLEGTQKYINEKEIELPISMGNSHAIIVSNTHALPAEYKCLK